MCRRNPAQSGMVRSTTRVHTTGVHHPPHRHTRCHTCSLPPPSTHMHNSSFITIILSFSLSCFFSCSPTGAAVFPGLPLGRTRLLPRHHFLQSPDQRSQVAGVRPEGQGAAHSQGCTYTGECLRVMGDVVLCMRTCVFVYWLVFGPNASLRYTCCDVACYN